MNWAFKSFVDVLKDNLELFTNYIVVLLAYTIANEEII